MICGQPENVHQYCCCAVPAFGVTAKSIVVATINLCVSCTEVLLEDSTRKFSAATASSSRLPLRAPQTHTNIHTFLSGGLPLTLTHHGCHSTTRRAWRSAWADQSCRKSGRANYGEYLNYMALLQFLRRGKQLRQLLLLLIVEGCTAETTNTRNEHRTNEQSVILRISYVQSAVVRLETRTYAALLEIPIP